MTKQEILKTHFGYDTFREGQEAVIDALLAEKDVLAVMPTGAGKSICYQVPALMMKGITLVISPLISLMKDQVRSLNQAGISAAYLNSSLTQGQYFTALRYAKAGRYPIIYVAPERLTTDAFLDFAQSADISMIAVDEAHCVSQWGQDFRPSYLKIAEFVAQLPKRPVISAFTATATKEVREDIARLLGLRDPFCTTTGFDRENLYFAVKTPKDKYKEVHDYILELQYVVVYFLVFIFRRFYRKVQILPVESCRGAKRIPKPQKPRDIFSYLFGCRSCKGADHRTLWKLCHKLRDLQITWSEVLSPLGNTVCLIHCDHGNIRTLSKIQKCIGGKPLRCHIDNRVTSCFCVTQSCKILSLCQGAV